MEGKENLIRRKKMKIFFSDLFPRCENFFRWLLPQRFDLEITSENPDIVIFSDFGNSHRRFDRAKKVYYTGENIRPDFSQCDYALTFDYLDDPRHYRLPLFVIENHSRWQEYGCIASFDAITNPRPPPDRIAETKTKFCNFIVSNPNCPIRDEFFKKLSLYKKVDSAGSHLNNLGYTLPKEPEKFFSAKLEFQKPYKFSIAFENSSHPGYLTEKILDPMYVHSIPLYWGDPLAHLDFNPKSFVNSAAFKDIDSMVNWIIQIDLNQELYFKYLEQPYLHRNEMSGVWNLEKLLIFFDTAIEI